jgi:potassium-dependent mechanosensitive channel
MIATINYLLPQRLADVLRWLWGYINHEFVLGRIKVSVSSFAEGILVLVGAIIVSRLLSSLIHRRLAKRIYIDPGIGYTIARLTYYFITALGILFALKLAIDLDLTSVAVLFTALSVGIGFGLQYIASDIAAGFILLFERPIRVGDRVTIDKDEGDVRSINLRTTIVQTNNRIAIIVPNSKLVRERVINWSWGDPRARIAIPIGVAPNSDVELVTGTLLRAAEGIDDVLKQPEPKVQFVNFGDSTLDFRLLVWTNKPRAHMQIKSDIHYRIDKLFREAGIEIPSPQFDVRLLGGSVSLAREPDLDEDILPADKPDRAQSETETAD